MCETHRRPSLPSFDDDSDSAEGENGSVQDIVEKLLRAIVGWSRLTIKDGMMTAQESVTILRQLKTIEKSYRKQLQKNR